MELYQLMDSRTELVDKALVIGLIEVIMPAVTTTTMSSQGTKLLQGKESDSEVRNE